MSILKFHVSELELINKCLVISADFVDNDITDLKLINSLRDKLNDSKDITSKGYFEIEITDIERQQIIDYLLIAILAINVDNNYNNLMITNIIYLIQYLK